MIKIKNIILENNNSTEIKYVIERFIKKHGKTIYVLDDIEKDVENSFSKPDTNKTWKLSEAKKFDSKEEAEEFRKKYCRMAIPAWKVSKQEFKKL